MARLTVESDDVGASRVLEYLQAKRQFIAEIFNSISEAASFARRMRPNPACTGNMASLLTQCHTLAAPLSHVVAAELPALLCKTRHCNPSWARGKPSSVIVVLVRSGHSSKAEQSLEAMVAAGSSLTPEAPHLPVIVAAIIGVQQWYPSAISHDGGLHLHPG